MKYSDDEIEAYFNVCSKLIKLCPRLVPSPLWGLTLAHLARIDPLVATVVCEDYKEAVNGIYSYWMNLPRGEPCQICGKPANEIDEKWMYYVYDPEGNPLKPQEIRDKRVKVKGVALLVDIRLLCYRCHLAKHQGYARIRGKGREALEHLAKVNNIDLEMATRLVNRAFHVHGILSRIRNWKIVITNIPGMHRDLRIKIEKLLNHMYLKGFSVWKQRLQYTSTNMDLMEERAARETAYVLRKASKGSTGNIQATVNSLFKIIYSELKQAGIDVYSNELNMLFNLMLEKPRYKRIFKTMLAGTLEYEDILIKIQLYGLEFLGGQWIVFVPKVLYPKVFTDILEELKKKRIDYIAELIASRKEIDKKEELPLFFYIPSFLSLKTIIETANTIVEIIKKYGIGKTVFFKPHLFTKSGIHSGKGPFKPYIYAISTKS